MTNFPHLESDLTKLSNLILVPIPLIFWFGQNKLSSLDKSFESTMLSLNPHKQLDYPLNKAYYVLILFSEESTLKSLLRRVQKDYIKFQNIHQYFLCKSVISLKDKEFHDGWITILSESKILSI